MSCWKKPHSKVVSPLKNKVERRYNLGDQMRGGRESPGSLPNTVHCWGEGGALGRDIHGESLGLPLREGRGDGAPI